MPAPPVRLILDRSTLLAYWRRVTGRIDLAAAALAALEHDAALLTSEDKLYGDDLPVIGFPY